MKRRYIWLTGASVLLVILIAGTLYSLHFASAVNQPHTAAGAIPATATPVPTSPSSTTGTPTSGASVQTYQIVPDQTTASYSVYENLIFENKPNNDAIGTTHSVQGSFGVRTDTSPLVTSMNVTVDLRTLQTDSQMRDNYVRRNALQTDTYPTATFVSVSTQNMPSTYNDGQNVHFQLIGNLTMHGKTNKTTFDVQGKVVGKTITGTATSTIYMTDFGIQPPNLANIAVSQNKVLVTINFTAKAS